MKTLIHRPTADPLLRLVAHALAEAHGREAATLWSAPHAFHLGTPDLVAAADWQVAAAAAPREDGLVRLSSLSHPARSRDLPLTGPPPEPSGWAARPYALIRALARAGYARGGIDLHVHGTLTPAAGLATAEPLDCVVALAVADAHATHPLPPPSRARLAALIRAAAPGGSQALRRAVLFAQPGRAALLLGDGRQRHVPFDPAAYGARLVLLAPRDGDPPNCPPPPFQSAHVVRLLRGGDPAALGRALGGPLAACAQDPDNGTDIGRAVRCALRAGALGAWWPQGRPGRSALMLVPHDRMTAVRAAVVSDFHSLTRPVPRFVNIAVAGAARREH
ncbi:galactokinase [Streptomyces gobiensis]|uniref:galactokinase n=1 Tax=Streptomyces gobiensis TaxID=2875706 RepID=UPI001E46AB53|nr:galactokinase [Streptomyces gobiensis]UGY94920.1 galactokinase [Streptomyces gobiensis]